MFSLVLGGMTGFVIRDELNMPTYMRIKTATLEHRMLARQKLSVDVLSLLDPNEAEHRIKSQREKIESAYEDSLRSDK